MESKQSPSHPEAQRTARRRQQGTEHRFDMRAIS